MPVFPNVGILIPGAQPPTDLIALARHAEQAGFAEVWVSEDYFYGGGIASAATVLGATSLPVGLGVAPVAGRHPAVLAMDVATLCGAYPGRLRIGLGAGIPDCLRQLGVTIRSPLRAVRDAVDAVRALLEGRSLTVDGAVFSTRGVEIAHPPAVPPPLYVGAGGPRMLGVAAACADGTVLSVLSGPGYVRWARQRLDEAGAASSHRVVVFALCAVDDDRDRARSMLRELVAAAALPGPRNPLSEQQGFADEAERLATLPWRAACRAIPERWLAEFTVSGTPEDIERGIRELSAAGADAVALCLPPGSAAPEMLRRIAREVLPRLSRSACAEEAH